MMAVRMAPQLFIKTFNSNVSRDRESRGRGGGRSGRAGGGMIGGWGERVWMGEGRGRGWGELGGMESDDGE